MEGSAPSFMGRLYCVFAVWRGLSQESSQSAGRYCVRWVSLHKMAVGDVGSWVLEGFGKHSCLCPRYWATPNSAPGYMAVVRMFVHLLEQRGLISSDRQRDIAAYLEPYIAVQKDQDYNALVVACMALDARHFA